MPNATRKICDFPGCSSGPPDANQLPTPFVTAADLRTREEVNEEMNKHVETAHMLAVRLAEANAKQLEMTARKIEMEAKKYELETARMQLERDDQASTGTGQRGGAVGVNNPPRGYSNKHESLPRPKIEHSSSELDWSFFEA